MKVILHIGAHRCATTTFQHYLCANRDKLRAHRIGYWGPERTRSGLFSGVLPNATGLDAPNRARRARGRLRIAMSRSAAKRIDHLIISEENILGGMRDNAASGLLYPGAGERLARYNQAFDGKIDQIALNIRAQDSYWASLFGFLVARGYGPWDSADLDRLTHAHRGWRDVISDIACAVPDARIRVLPFEVFSGRPEAQLAACLPVVPPRPAVRLRHNATLRGAELRALASPDMAALIPAANSRWTPFTPPGCAALRRAYGDDITWLKGGGDGLAELATDPAKIKPDAEPDYLDSTRGNGHDHKESRMAQTRRRRIARQASREPDLANARGN